jgi:hypothetical protein
MIKFTKDYQVKAAGGPSYKAGEVVYDLPQRSEEHFVARGVAERVTAPRAPKLPSRRGPARSPAPPSPAIPDDWQALPAEAQQALAAEISGGEVKTKEAAAKIIEAEAAKRAGLLGA